MKIELMIFTTLFLSQMAHAQSLPDEIDYVTYRDILQRSSQESSSLRAQANAIRDRIISLESQIKNNEQRISSSTSTISQNESTSVSLLEENSNRYNNIAMLNQDNERLRNELSDLSRQYNSLNQDLNNIDRQLAPARSELERVGAQWNSIRAQGEQARREYSDFDRRIQQTYQDLQKEQDFFQKINEDIQQTTIRITELQARISPLEGQISRIFDDLNKLNMEHARLMKISQQLNSELPAVEQELGKKQAQLKSAETVLVPMKERTEALRKEATKIQNEKKSLDAQVGQADGKIQGLKKEIAQIPAQIAAEKQKLDAMTERSGKIDTLIADARAGQTSNLEKIKTLEAEIEKLKAEERSPQNQMAIRRAENQISSIKVQNLRLEQEEAKLVAEKTNFDANVAAANQAIETLNGKKAEIEPKIAALEETKKGLEAQSSQLDSGLAEANRNLQSSERELDLATQGLKAFRDAVAQAENDVKQKKNQIAKADAETKEVLERKDKTQDLIALRQKELENLKRQIPQEFRRIEDAKREAQASRGRQDQIARDLSNLRDRLQGIANLIERLNQDDQRSAAQYAAINDQVQRLEGIRSSLLSQIADVTNRSNSDQAQLEKNADAIAQNSSRIQQNINTVATLKDANTQLRADIANSQSAIVTMTRDLGIERQSFAGADLKARDAEAVTAKDKKELASREDLYGRYLNDAKIDGNLQGDSLALPLGQKDGEARANIAGRDIGTRIGLETALLDGQYRGLLRGKLSGDSEGYTAGVNSAQDYEKGRAVGYSTGKETARQQALRDNYPAAYKREREVLLKNIPSANVSLSNLDDKGLESGIATNRSSLSETRNDIKGLLTDTELSAEEIAAALDLKSAINPQVEKVVAVIKEYSRPERNLSLASIVYVRPETTPYNAANAQCDNVYKNVAAFKAACQTSFKDQFNTTYLAAHKNLFNQNYSAAYTESRNANFALHKNDNFEAGRSESYRVVFLESKAKGAVVAEARGVTEGKAAGYQENLASLQQEHDRMGVAKVQAFFSNNGVIRSTGKGTLQATDSRGLAQGSKGKLGLKLANLGGAATKRNDVVVSFKALTDNVNVSTPKTALRGLPKNTKVDLANISEVRISEDAVPGSKISIKATLSYKGDDVTPSFEEETTIDGIVTVNPEIGSALAYEQKVDYKKWVVFPLKWKFNTYAINVNLEGLRDNVPEGYKVEVSVAGGSDYVKMDNTSVKTKAIGRGEKATAGFTYTFVNKVKDDTTLKFKVRIKYLDEVLSEKIINVTATN